MSQVHEQVKKPNRTLVLCFDGTANEYDEDNTNIVKLFSFLKKDDIDEQMCFYQPGIGTYYYPGAVSPFLLWAAKYIDIAFASYLDEHVLDGYRYLMQHYRRGDKISIFGFSRGAYTARALAGFLHKVGLLPRDNQAQVLAAYKMYKRTDRKGLHLCAGFKRTYCISVGIEFMGVWDTVSSVGVFMGRTLPFVNSNRSIKRLRHALSLDEHRAKYRPNNYYKSTPSSGDMGTNEDLKSIQRHSESTANTQTETKGPVDTRSSRSSSDEIEVEPTNKAFAPELIEKDPPLEKTDVLEVYFAGCHGDVGGGSVPNETSSALANISLRWMIHEIIASGCGIKFDAKALELLKIDHSPTCSLEEVQMDKEDALCKKHSAFKKRPLWWLLELIPLHYSYQGPEGNWHRELNVNLGKGRKIREAQPIFHASVKTKMEESDYKPKARWTEGTEVYVQ